jgi:hypothetical protein
MNPSDYIKKYRQPFNEAYQLSCTAAAQAKTVQPQKL